METQIQKKPRFLCLHGFRTSAEILRKQLLRRWPETVLGKLDLDFQEYYNFEECLAHIEDYMIKHGPFDGLMGFSQGAIISAALPGMQLDGVALTKVPKIKYVIILSGGKFGGSMFGSPKLAVNAFSSPVKCSSLHIIDEKGLKTMLSFIEKIDKM
ncbi:hypothetical protein C3L33_18070, partial [Rhododendron williamsianum]